MENEPRTIEQIRGTIRAAGDSVWVVEDTIEQLNAGKSPTSDRKGNIERNISHLKLVAADPEIVNSGEDISSILACITIGEAKLAQTTWV